MCERGLTEQDIDNENEIENDIEDRFSSLPSVINLPNGFVVKKRKQMCVIRYYCPKIEKDPEKLFQNFAHAL